MQGISFSSFNSMLGTALEAFEKQTEKAAEHFATIGNIADDFINAALDLPTGEEAADARAAAADDGVAKLLQSTTLQDDCVQSKQQRAWDENAWEDMGDDWGDNSNIADEDNVDQVWHMKLRSDTPYLCAAVYLRPMSHSSACHQLLPAGSQLTKKAAQLEHCTVGCCCRACQLGGASG